MLSELSVAHNKTVEKNKFEAKTTKKDDEAPSFIYIKKSVKVKWSDVSFTAVYKKKRIEKKQQYGVNKVRFFIECE